MITYQIIVSTKKFCKGENSSRIRTIPEKRSRVIGNRAEEWWETNQGHEALEPAPLSLIAQTLIKQIGHAFNGIEWNGQNRVGE